MFGSVECSSHDAIFLFSAVFVIFISSFFNYFRLLIFLVSASSFCVLSFIFYYSSRFYSDTISYFKSLTML